MRTVLEVPLLYVWTLRAEIRDNNTVNLLNTFVFNWVCCLTLPDLIVFFSYVPYYMNF